MDIRFFPLPFLSGSKSSPKSGAGSGFGGGVSDQMERSLRSVHPRCVSRPNDWDRALLKVFDPEAVETVELDAFEFGAFVECVECVAPKPVLRAVVADRVEVRRAGVTRWLIEFLSVDESRLICLGVGFVLGGCFTGVCFL